MATISELAERENLDNSYVAKVMQLTLLAPDIVEMILDGRQPEAMTWRKGADGVGGAEAVVGGGVMVIGAAADIRIGSAPCP
ncbi:MAG: hypothetical protein HQL64_12275 [Magnetococcales bacterium]|nr:hypothetical protein [Magnetococcales bacterium]